MDHLTIRTGRSQTLVWLGAMIAALVAGVSASPAHADPVAPGHFLYHYDFHVELDISGVKTRIKGQPRHAFQELHRCFNCSFPIKGAPRAFPGNGQYIPLQACFVNLQPCRPAPVKFYTSNAYSFKLIAQPGHFEGADSSLLFLFYTDRDGFLHLTTTAYVTDPSLSEEIIKNQAFLSWQRFAQNLGRNLYNNQCPRGVCR